MKFFPRTYDEKTIKNLFKNKNKISKVNLIRNQRGKSKGFAYIDFASNLDA